MSPANYMKQLHGVQEHLHQASLVFKPHTDLGSRIKLASRLMPGLCSSMAGRKCKEVLYLPSKVVQALKVHAVAAYFFFRCTLQLSFAVYETFPKCYICT